MTKEQTILLSDDPEELAKKVFINPECYIARALSETTSGIHDAEEIFVHDSVERAMNAGSHELGITLLTEDIKKSGGSLLAGVVYNAQKLK